MKTLRFLLCVLFFMIVISLTTDCTSVQSPNDFDQDLINFNEIRGLKLDHLNNIDLNINIIESETLFIKLFMIPPDSGYWVIEEDTIHIDSLENYLKSNSIEVNNANLSCM